MTHSYVAYIDESGCHGRKFYSGSSEFLVMAAVVIPSWWDDDAKDLFEHARILHDKSGKFLKFSKLKPPDDCDPSPRSNERLLVAHIDRNFGPPPNAAAEQ